MLTALYAMDAANITQSDATIYDPPLIFLTVWEVDCVVVVRNAGGDLVTYTVPSVANGGGAPFVIPGRIRQVMSTNTTAADASLVGYAEGGVKTTS